MYIKELKNLAKEENILANIEVTDISKFPDVLTIKSNSDDETIKNELLKCRERDSRYNNNRTDPERKVRLFLGVTTIPSEQLRYGTFQGCRCSRDSPGSSG